MKNIFNLSMLAITTTILLACSNNDEAAVAKTPQSGISKINPSTDSVILTKPNSNQTAISFNWEASNYNVNTLKTYTLEIDVLNGDFSNPEIDVTDNTQLSLTHGKLNAMVVNKNLPIGLAGQIKVRLKTSLKYNALPTYSKVEIITVTPYEDLMFALPLSNTLYLQGSAVTSNWSYPVPNSQKLTRVPNKAIYTITTQLTGNKEFAFISSNSAWGDPAYKALTSNQPLTGGQFTENGSATSPSWIGANIKTPAASGIYTITINFTTGTYTVTPQ